jgi:hypothetical protein
MKQALVLLSLLLGMVHGPVNAVSVDLTSGTTGTSFLNQSFNGETRVAEVTVLGGLNLAVSSMTLNAIDIRTGTTTMGARVYDTTGTLLAFADITPAVAENQSVTIPISTTLIAGQNYRLGFFVGSSAAGNNVDLFDPDPSGPGVTPYTETNGLFQIIGAFSGSGDGFPTNTNIGIPTMMGLEVSAVPLPGALWFFGSGLLGLIGTARRRKAA